MRKTGMVNKSIISGIIAASAFLSHYASHAAEPKPEQVAISAEPENKPDFKIGYKIHDSNSSLKNAKVILIGESYYMNDRETSDFFKNYLKDGDAVLVAGEPKGESLEGCVKLSGDADTIENILANPEHRCLEQRMDFWNIFHPKLYGIKASGKKVSVEGAENMEAYHKRLEIIAKKASLNQRMPDFLKSKEKMQSEIKEAEKKQEQAFIESVYLSIKKTNGKVYLLLGSHHLPKGDITNELKEKGIKYVAFMPKKSEVSEKKQRK